VRSLGQNGPLTAQKGSDVMAGWFQIGWQLVRVDRVTGVQTTEPGADLVMLSVLIERGPGDGVPLWTDLGHCEAGMAAGLLTTFLKHLACVPSGSVLSVVKDERGRIRNWLVADSVNLGLVPAGRTALEPSCTAI